MKKIITAIFIFLYTNVLLSQYTNWITVGGNNNRNGYSQDSFGGLGMDETYNAPSTLWGMPIFCFENKFVTTRYTSLSPLRALIVSYNFGQSNPQWTYGANSGVNIIMGFNNDKVFVRDFQQNGYDTIFALNSSDGSLVWKSRFTVERGIIWTAVFASNGDLILPGSDSKRIMRINQNNGDTVWTNNRIIPNTGAETMCINGNTLYAWQGGITTPKTIIAIDVNTGVTKYSSVQLPGDGDQEIPFSVSNSGVVYCIRDGGLMYAIKDNGNSLDIIWSRNVIQPVGTYTQIGIGRDSSVYIPNGRKIFRLNHLNGNAIDSSVDLVNSGNINPRFAISRFGIMLSNGADVPTEGKFFYCNTNLQIVQQYPFAYNYYCGPALGGAYLNPHVLYTGAGTQIKGMFSIIDGIAGTPFIIPDKPELTQNYPNPFNPITNIIFSIPKNGDVSLKIYDLHGSEIETLINGNLNAGTYNVKFNGTNYSSGVYFYKLKHNGYVETKKMNLIK